VPTAQHAPRYALPIAIAFGLALFLGSMTWQVPAVRASSGPLDPEASELVRLINGVRATRGLSQLGVDTFLASKARDGAIPCPDDASKSIYGRAQDFAAEGTMSHFLRLCDTTSYTLSTTLFLTDVQSWGYGSVGEIMVDNGGYGTGAYLYSYNGWETWTYSTTGHAMQGWAGSSSHWDIVMGSYDRVGCGGWTNGGAFWYDCVLSAGGPNGKSSPPTASPFNLPLPTPTPAPVPKAPPAPTPQPPAPAPVSGGGSAGGSGSGGGPAASTAAVAGSSAAESFGPWDLPNTTAAMEVAGAVGAGSAAASPTFSLAAATNGSSPNDGSTGLLAVILRLIAIVAGSGAGVLYGCAAFMRRRRRRETAS
jgi:hypothetical protein